MPAAPSAPSGSNGFSPSGSPVDIPVTIAKVIRPVKPLSVLATPYQSHVTFSAEAEPNASINLYDKNQTLIAQTSADEAGNFSVEVPFATVPYEEPVSFAVSDGDDLSPAVTVRTFSDSTFMVGVSRQPLSASDLNEYSVLPTHDLAYSDLCSGILYNAQHSDLHYALLCTNLDNTETVVIDDRLEAPLQQLQVSPDSRFAVGLNPDNEIVHLNLETGVETIITDRPVEASHPVIRLAPNGSHVVTTMDSGTLPHWMTIEPTGFAPGDEKNDSIVLNEGIIFYNIVECDWMGDTSVQCIIQNPLLAADRQYRMARFNMAPTFNSGNKRPVINWFDSDCKIFGTSIATPLRNLRMNPNFGVMEEWNGGAYSYESETDILSVSNDRHSMKICGPGITPCNHATSVKDTRWEPEGVQLNVAVHFNSSLYPNIPKIIRYDPTRILVTRDGKDWSGQHASYGTKPLPIGNDTTAYVCQNADGKYDICALNWNNLN